MGTEEGAVRPWIGLALASLAALGCRASAAESQEAGDEVGEASGSDTAGSTETDTTETDTTETETETESTTETETETETGSTTETESTTGSSDSEDSSDSEESGPLEESEADTGPTEPCLETCGNPGCGVCPGTEVIDLDTYGIDATEATVDEYGQFLAVDMDPAFLAPTCTWKADFEDFFEPEVWAEQLLEEGDRPVAGVDWCDAEAYCRWSGKRLCAMEGGAPVTLEDVVDLDSEWYSACSEGGMKEYPYGDAYQALGCNGTDLGVDEVVGAGSLPGCQGGSPGLYDMSGNVWEWTGACGEEAMKEDFEQDCRRRGGSWFSSSFVMRCGVDSTRVQTFRAANTGIRCCSD